MAAKFFDAFHFKNKPEQQQKLKLSPLQETILCWLYEIPRQRQATSVHPGVPYPELAQAIHTDRASLTDSVRRLMHHGLVTASLPRGAWARYVTLTDDGTARVKELLQESRRPVLRRRR